MSSAGGAVVVVLDVVVLDVVQAVLVCFPHLYPGSAYWPAVSVVDTPLDPEWLAASAACDVATQP